MSSQYSYNDYGTGWFDTPYLYLIDENNELVRLGVAPFADISSYVGKYKLAIYCQSGAATSGYGTARGRITPSHIFIA